MKIYFYFSDGFFIGPLLSGNAPTVGDGWAWLVNPKLSNYKELNC